MEREQFWEDLDTCWQKGDMEQFWKLWDYNAEYIQEYFDKLHAEVEDPQSQRRKQHDEWWAAFYPKLVEALGEEWVKENCKSAL